MTTNIKAFLNLKAVVAALALAALPLAAQAADLVRLGNLKFAHYGAVAYMKEIAPKYNLKIEERMFSKGLDIVPAIIAGEIDVSASALEAAISGRASGVPVYLVGGFAKGGVRIVGRPELNIRSIADLKGKKIGVTRGGPQEILLFSELAKNKMSWSDKPGKDVLIMYMGYPDLNQALLTKDIDAMSQSEPYSTQAIHKQYGSEIMKPYDTPLGEPVRALVMSEKCTRKSATWPNASCSASSPPPACSWPIPSWQKNTCAKRCSRTRSLPRITATPWTTPASPRTFR